MCPACIGSALLLWAGAGAAGSGGLAVVATRVLGSRSQKNTQHEGKSEVQRSGEDPDVQHTGG